MGNINESQVTSISQQLESKQPNLISDVSGFMSSPLTSVIQRLSFRINDLTNKIDSRINDLINETRKALGNKGSVENVNGSIIITIKPEYNQIAELQKSKIENHINSIIRILDLLKSGIDGLSLLQDLANTLVIGITVATTVLSTTPPLVLTIPIIKKHRDLEDLKKMILAQIPLITNIVSTSNIQYQFYSDKFRNIHVDIKMESSSNEGNYISHEDAEEKLIDDKLGDSDSKSENYLNLILKVEKYGKKQLIGRAYEQYSGLLRVETAPSYTSKPEALLSELKNILK